MAGYGCAAYELQADYYLLPNNLLNTQSINQTVVSYFRSAQKDRAVFRPINIF